MPIIINKEEKKIKIIEASIQVFAKKGIAKTKMIDIAEAAGIGKGTIYEYFNSKDDIFNAGFHYFIERINTIVAKHLYQVYDPLEKLSAFFAAQLDVMNSISIDFIEIMLDFWAEGIRNKNDASTFNLVKMYKDYQLMLKTILDECVKHKKIKSVNTEVLSSIIIGALDGIMLQWILGVPQFDIEKTIKLFEKTIIDGVRK